MFKWVYYWCISRKIKQNLKRQIEWARNAKPYAPPTEDELHAFITEMDVKGCKITQTHYIESVKHKRTNDINISEYYDD